MMGFTTSWYCECLLVWRRGRDSNPRDAFDAYPLSRRAPSAARTPLLRMIEFFQDNDGGDERDRTADLLVANETLSQLSYIPSTKFFLAKLFEKTF